LAAAGVRVGFRIRRHIRWLDGHDASREAHLQNVPPEALMELHEIATPLAYCLATLIAAGFWAAVHVQLLQKRQLTVQSMLLLVTVLAVAWGIVRFGMR
jgi:hypothetical protein